MYSNILIPTDGSELADKAIHHGIALANRIGAQVTVLTVLLPFHVFTTDSQMLEDTLAQYNARMRKRAETTSWRRRHRSASSRRCVRDDPR